jgi:hypothetical protein
MNTLTKRTLLAALAALFTLFAIPSALAQQLPQHVRVQTIQPLLSESSSGLPPEPPDFGRLDTQFGADVAVRNGVAVIGMPRTEGTGRVASIYAGEQRQVDTNGHDQRFRLNRG